MRKARDSRAETRERPGYQRQRTSLKKKKEEIHSTALTPVEKDVYGHKRGRQSSGRTVKMKLKYCA